MKTLILFAVLACCFAVYGQGGHWEPPLPTVYHEGDWCGGGSGSKDVVCADGVHKWVDKQTVGVVPHFFGIEREPFDVAPQQWDIYRWQNNNNCPKYQACIAIYISPTLEAETHWDCKMDPRRTLLTSEDQVKHCYDLGRLGDTSR